MKIKWLGHSCFEITTESNIKIITDPCDPTTGYKLENIETDILTISHGHHDHNYTPAISHADYTFSQAGEFEACGIKIRGIKSFHDDCNGEKRGENIIFCFEIEGMTVAHMGDIGYFDEALAAQIGNVDVLLVPVGGVFTIDAVQARQLANMLKAKAVIPMHYKTPALSFELDDVGTFVDNAANCSIHRLNRQEVYLSKEFMGEDRILILSYK